ncbi:unnamed protein product [Vitrella brassicaformis CCMP3155]|uniref:Importin subunit alpha n=1 Tax=Vitrella brassicaformis (strain CCMP3155) TaxID=1169540 RepID=A0A0G4FAU8_VITBC|nr:unnamed protein product [Vitrella brassicaformis CCMP3155]|eukprot:CEM10015.1 unnamed protein product [Vitrella brassicaformis CCMP3155]
MADICQLLASASGPQVRVSKLLRPLSTKHMCDIVGQKAVDAGVVPALVGQLSECEEMQIPATLVLALSMLAADHAAAVVDAGAVPPLVQLVSSGTDRVRLAAIAALRMIMEGSVDRRDAVVAAGVLQPLLPVTRESSDTDVLTWSARLVYDLWSVAENEPLPIPLAELAPFVPVLVGLIAAPEQDDRVLQSARGALAQYSVCVEEDGTDADRDALVEHGAVASMGTLLADKHAKSIGYMIVHCMTTGTTAHKQAVIDADLVPLLVDLAAGEKTDPNLKKIAEKIIGNIVRGGSQRQVEHVVECGGIQPISGLLDGENDNRLTAMLWLLDKILSGSSEAGHEGLPDNPYSTLVDQAGGVDKVVELQTYNDMGVALQAIVCLISHFPTRVDAQRLEALIEAGVIRVVQADEVETNVGADDDIGSDGDSDGGGEGDGQLEGDSRGEREEG